MALKTVLNKIIVEPVEAETKTASGIIIPDSAKEKPQKGIVVATGKGKHDEPMEIKVGDSVLFGKYSGTEGKKLFFKEVGITKYGTSPCPTIGSKFTFEKLLTSIDYSYSIPYINKNGRSGTEENVGYSIQFSKKLSSLSNSQLKELFNGVNPVFDYTYTINGVSYKESFPLTYDGVNASNISVDNSALIF